MDLVASFRSDNLLLAICSLAMVGLLKYWSCRPHIALLSWDGATRDLFDALAACRTILPSIWAS